MAAQEEISDTYQGLTTEQVQNAKTTSLIILHKKLHQSFDAGDLNQHLKSTTITNLLVHQELFRRGMLIHKTDNSLDMLSARFAHHHGIEKSALEELAFSLGDQHQIRLCSIQKKDEDQQIVFGIVLEPGTMDAQKDIMTADNIEMVAHKWLSKFQNRGLMHEKIINNQVEIYQSYIAPVEFKIGKEKIKKGTWLLMYHVLDPDLWMSIKAGELTGFSIGGLGTRTELN